MNKEHLAKVNSNSKSKEKIQLSKWHEKASFWHQSSNYHRKWREQQHASVTGVKSATPTSCVTSAEMALGLRQTSHSSGAALPSPPFFFCGCWCNFFSTPPSATHLEEEQHFTVSLESCLSTDGKTTGEYEFGSFSS